jgi:hypothetical protein
MYYQVIEKVLDFPTSMLDFPTTQYQKRLITRGVSEYLTCWHVTNCCG